MAVTLGNAMSLQATATINSLHLPFSDGRPSIHALISAAIASRGEAARSLVLELPEAGNLGSGVRFIAGGLDALLGRRDKSPRQTAARTVVAALTKALRQPSANTLTGLYQKLRGSRATAIVDEMIERLRQELAQNREPLAALARRLVREAPDVEPVKIGIALLGASGEPGDEPLLIEIGQSEELTLFATVALCNLLPDAEQAIWRLAQRVHGWGRISTVERLAGTDDVAIKQWLLRDGFRNEIMYEYLAQLAANSGGLLDALTSPRIDDALLLSAAQILAALIAGGPASDIFDYRDGAAACVAFLRHALTRETPVVRVVSAVVDIKRLVENRAERLRAAHGWSAQAFLDVRTHSAAFLQKPGARAAVELGLASNEPWGDYFVASAIAPQLGIDPWPRHLERQRNSVGRNWWHLMQTDDPVRIEQVLALARAQLDLALIGSGPTDSLGLGQEFGDDDALDFVVQDLGRFPGLGWDLIQVSLKARTIRLRNMAINALHEWGRDRWPPATEAALKDALRGEPEDDVRQRLRDLLAGRLED